MCVRDLLRLIVQPRRARFFLLVINLGTRLAKFSFVIRRLQIRRRQAIIRRFASPRRQLFALLQDLLKRLEKHRFQIEMQEDQQQCAGDGF